MPAATLVLGLQSKTLMAGAENLFAVEYQQTVPHLSTTSAQPAVYVSSCAPCLWAGGWLFLLMKTVTLLCRQPLICLDGGPM